MEDGGCDRANSSWHQSARAAKSALTFSTIASALAKSNVPAFFRSKCSAAVWLACRKASTTKASIRLADNNSFGTAASICSNFFFLENRPALAGEVDVAQRPGHKQHNHRRRLAFFPVAASNGDASPAALSIF